MTRSLSRSTVGVCLASALLAWLLYAACLSTLPVYPPGSLPDDARGQGAGSCRMSYMSPSFLHLEGFDREHSRLGAGPWGLYLYREAGWDEQVLADGRLHLTGSPVVFVPGNAGSFRQVRSLASAASRTYWDVPGVKRKGLGGPGAAPLDFFTLDFNDDFSAFHGQTVRDQAEYLADAVRYILALYVDGKVRTAPDPTSVIVVAHSMGGVVARSAFTHRNFQNNSISTVITLATPHIVPPATVDKGVDDVYKQVAEFWQHPPAESFVVSIAGGVSDQMISSETTALAPSISDQHGFGVFTTAIPGVTTPIDHLAVLWCQQLQQVLARAILSVVDVRVSEGVVSRIERAETFRRHLLGIEPKNLTTARKISRPSMSETTRLGVGERLHSSRPRDERRVFEMPIPPSQSYGPSLSFSLLTSGMIGRSKDHEVDVFACQANQCTALSPSHLTRVPLSSHAPVSPVLPAMPEHGTMQLVSIDAAELADYQSIVVTVRPGTSWILAEWRDKESSRHVSSTKTELLFGRWKQRLGRSLVQSVWIPSLDSSLLTLKLKAHRSGCQESEALFAPMARLSSRTVQETKFYPNVREAQLYTHQSGPYMPAQHISMSQTGSTLTVYSDPTCDGDIAIELVVDAMSTLGNLVTRYRMALVSLPAAIVLLVASFQLRAFNDGAHFPTFNAAFDRIVKAWTLPILGALLLLSLSQSIYLSTHLASSSKLQAVAHAQGEHALLPPVWMSSLLMGGESAFFSFVAPFFYLLSLGIVFFEHLALSAIVHGGAFVVQCLSSRGSSWVQTKMRLNDEQASVPLHRVLSLAALLLLVLFFAPYQFAFLVLFLVQLLNTIRLLVVARDSTSAAGVQRRACERFEYSYIVTFIMACLLPINALILVVWVRNLAVGWLAPFSSDHNVLKIVGFLLNVEGIHSGKSIERNTNDIARTISYVLPALAAAYSVLYGIRYTYVIFPLANAFFIWLTLNCSEFIGSMASAANDAAKRRRRNSVIRSEKTSRSEKSTPTVQGGLSRSTSLSSSSDTARSDTPLQSLSRASSSSKRAAAAVVATNADDTADSKAASIDVAAPLSPAKKDDTGAQ